MTRRIIMLLIFFTCLTFYLAFNAYIPVTDPVESNYALTAKEMVLSGDWLSPQIYGHYWFDKPIMIYWLIALSFKCFGITDFAARFPSALFSAASVAFTYWFGHILFNKAKVALFSALVLATSLEFWVLAKMIITDAVLFFFTSISLGMLYLGLKTTKSIWYIILAYIAAAIAVLTKGPVGIVLPGLIICSYIAFTRQWKVLKRVFILPGILVFFLVAAPWYIKMYQLHGQSFIDTFFGLHNYLRATVSEHPKDNVFYYYFILFPVSLLPWTGVFLKSLDLVRKENSSSHLIFLVSWVIVTIVFYTLMATKYLTYVFPASFPAALLIGYTLARMQTMQERKVWWWLSIPAIALQGIIAISNMFLPVAINWNLVYIATITSTMLIFWVQLRGNIYQMAPIIALTTTLVSIMFIHNGLIPLAETRSAKNIAAILPVEDAIVGFYGEYSTSAVYYSGYNILQLVQNHESQQEDTWSSKYTMPTSTMIKFNNYSIGSYILVKNSDKNNFTREPLAINFYPIATGSAITLYQRVALK